MPIGLAGTVAEANIWRHVSGIVEDWLEASATSAAEWSVTVRRKIPTDDESLLLDGEADDPADYWAVFVDYETQTLVVAVPVEGDENLIGPGETAACLIQLLCDATEPL